MNKITVENVYHGELTFKSEIRQNVQPDQSHDLKIAVSNDSGTWMVCVLLSLLIKDKKGNKGGKGRI